MAPLSGFSQATLRSIFCHFWPRGWTQPLRLPALLPAPINPIPHPDLDCPWGTSLLHSFAMVQWAPLTRLQSGLTPCHRKPIVHLSPQKGRKASALHKAAQGPEPNPCCTHCPASGERLPRAVTRGPKAASRLLHTPAWDLNEVRAAILIKHWDFYQKPWMTSQ